MRTSLRQGPAAQLLLIPERQNLFLGLFRTYVCVFVRLEVLRQTPAGREFCWNRMEQVYGL